MSDTINRAQSIHASLLNLSAISYSAVRDVLADLIDENKRLTAERDAAAALCDGLAAENQELKAAAGNLLDATGHSTWSKLFPAPSVELSIQRMKDALADHGTDCDCSACCPN